jgi:hypothetical protein
MPGDQAQPEREQKQKGDKPKMKLFSKPKHIGISRDKDSYGKDKGIPSPSKMGFPGSSGLARIVSGSTDTLPSNNSSMYSLSNASVSTVVPADRQTSSEKDKDKDKDKAHKHHFLSRQKLKLKDRDDHYNLPLSSASSNSKPSDPNAPQSLYSFTPASPNAGSTTFSKTVGGLDLLHGGRALREKKERGEAEGGNRARLGGYWGYASCLFGAVVPWKLDRTLARSCPSGDFVGFRTPQYDSG